MATNELCFSAWLIWVTLFLGGDFVKKSIKKATAVLLAVIMVLSVFTIIP
ncbi:MAG: surface glycoprotein, partial [Clostridia bacterium]|nr:surface glycoprotein [Clostridia bacterium]